MKSLLWKDYDLLSEEEYSGFTSEIDDCVFEDVKIRRVLETVYDNYSDSDEVIEVLRKIPNRDSLIYRQDFFEDVLNDKEDITKLYYKLVSLVSRYESLFASTENIKKRLHLVMYIYNFFKYIEEVNEIINKNQYKSYIVKEISKDISIYIERKKDLYNKVNNLYHRVSNLFDITATHLNGSPYISIDLGKKENLEDDMVEIAKMLNISLDKSARLTVRKEVNPYYLFNLVNNDEKLKNDLMDFYETYHNDIIDLSKLSKELKFYLLMKTLFESVNSKGVPYTKALVTDGKTSIKDIYDISLTLSKINAVPNDFFIDDNENMQFVLGVNSGGKTCYIRSLGINYVLFSSVGFMFAKEAEVFPMKYIYTHFPNEENYKVGEGRLIDEISRLNKMKKTFSSESIALLNETFSSTSEDKACTLTMELIDNCMETKGKVIFVTHQYKIFDNLQNSNIGFYTPFVVEGENNIRTYKIKKVEKKLLSYVGDILKKHGLTKEQLLKRKKS